MQHVFMCRGTEVIHVGHLLKFGISFYLPFIPAPRGTGVRAGGERGALCRTAVDPGVHSERGETEMLTQLCPVRHCRRFPSILSLLNRAPRAAVEGGGRGVQAVVCAGETKHGTHPCSNVAGQSREPPPPLISHLKMKGKWTPFIPLQKPHKHISMSILRLQLWLLLRFSYVIVQFRTL